MRLKASELPGQMIEISPPPMTPVALTVGSPLAAQDDADRSRTNTTSLAIHDDTLIFASEIGRNFLSAAAVVDLGNAGQYCK